MAKYIFHCDMNNAYLSIEAAYRLQSGETLDLRTVPSIVGGSEASRHGIVLAKSNPAKAFLIKTGEPVRDAYDKCPHLISVPPNYGLYMKASAAMHSILQEYASRIHRYSVDESFFVIDNSFSGQDPVEIATEIKDRIKSELNITVSVGISHNKLLAKMASDMRKPDKVTTLFEHEVADKMWPLPIGDLFFAGPATQRKLKNIGIHTIGQLANTAPDLICKHLGNSHGMLLYNYSRGIDHSPMRKSNHEVTKGIGNSTTVHFDVGTRDEAKLVLLSLAESVSWRLRQSSFAAGLISVHIKNTDFQGRGHQRKIPIATDSTTYIHKIAMELFDELWTGEPLRKLGLRVSDLHTNEYIQLSLLEQFDFKKQKAIDQAIDSIRSRYGSSAVQRSSFLHSGIRSLTGGIQDDGDDSYPLMSSIL